MASLNNAFKVSDHLQRLQTAQAQDLKRTKERLLNPPLTRAPEDCRHILESYSSKSDMYCVKCGSNWSELQHNYPSHERGKKLDEGFKLASLYSNDGLLKLDFESSEYSHKHILPTIIHSKILNCQHSFNTDQMDLKKSVCRKCKQKFSVLAKYYSPKELHDILTYINPKPNFQKSIFPYLKRN